jgi:hypothetical protein
MKLGVPEPFYATFFQTGRLKPLGAYRLAKVSGADSCPLWGQKRKSDRLNGMSALPLMADFNHHPWHVRKVPQTEVKRHAITCTTLNDIGCHGAFSASGLPAIRKPFERGAEAAPQRCRGERASPCS